MRFKSIIVVIVIGIIFVFTLIRGDKIGNEPTIGIPPASHTSTPPITPRESTGIQSSWILIRDVNKISLHSNLGEKLSAIDFKEKYDCDSVINGGFYSTDPTSEGKHIGLFIEEGKDISIERQNSLFNGFFASASGKPLITTETPENARFALQTGPILIEDGNIRKLSLVRDEAARRMAVGVTSAREIVFMTFYDASSLVSGPKLVDLPKLVQELGDENNIEITDAINLDGGSHSAFISSEVQLTDIQAAGSYFCVKD